jgi:hypothetical protein
MYEPGYPARVRDRQPAQLFRRLLALYPPPTPGNTQGHAAAVEDE